MQLRLSKVSELIHNSTDHQNLRSARVSVFFEEVIDTVRLSCRGLYAFKSLDAPMQSGMPSGTR